MKKHFLMKVFLVIAALLIVLTGCKHYNSAPTGGQSSGGTSEQSSGKGTNSQKTSTANFNSDVFNFATNEAIPHLDPAGSASNTAFREEYMIYDRLVSYRGTSTEVQPDLAKSWHISNDGKTYTFHLQKNAKFHDGTPVTAKAVKYSFLRALKVGKSAAGIFKGIIDQNSFDIVDPHTIKITLKKPFAPFIQALGTSYAAIINPKLKQHAGNDYGQSYISDHDMGSGPYILESWDRGQKMVLKANENYWGGKPKLKKINILIIPEPSTARLRLEKGDVDLLDYTMLSPQVLKQMKGEKGITLKKSRSFGIDYMPINITKKPFNKVKVRQAIAYSVNYDALLKNVYLGNAERVGGAVPKGMFGYNQNVKMYHYNLDKAKKLLAEAGYPNGFTAELAISKNNSVRKNIALLLQSDLAKIGVKIKIKQYSWPTFLNLVTSGKHQLALASWTPDYADPDYNLWYFADSASKGVGFNLAFYGNKKVDQLLSEARVSTDKSVRKKDYHEIQSIMAKDVPYVFIAQPKAVAPVRNWVKGYQINPMNPWYVPFQKMSKQK